MSDNTNNKADKALNYFSTKLTHPDPFEPFKGAANPPVHHTSTILFDTVDDFHNSDQRHKERGQSSYGLYGNTASYMLEELLTEMEGGAGCVLTSSGLSAITLALMTFLRSGDHVLITNTVYEPSRIFANHYLEQNGIEVEYYDPTIGAGIAALVKPNTKVILLESPGSLTFEIQDTPAICAIAKQHNIITMMDNTWATPLYHQPLSLGVDISLHAVTKYIAGHSDLLMGAIIANDKTIKALRKHSQLFGNYVASDDIYLALRGLRTMTHRLRVHEKNAITVAKWLESQSDKYPIASVIHPALPSHPQHALWSRDFTGATGLFAFVLRGVDNTQVNNMMNDLKYFGMGFSWGGYSSLVTPLKNHTYRQENSNDTDTYTLVRIYIGLEHVDDLIEDLQQGLDRL